MAAPMRAVFQNCLQQKKQTWPALEVCRRFAASAQSIKADKHHRSNPGLPTQKRHVDNEEEIHIPERIERTPTSILEALSSTVHKDPTGSEYKFLDDPNLSPLNQLETKTFAAAVQSGKEIAQMAYNKWPELFQPFSSSPEVKDFTPVLLEHEPNTEAGLLERIQHDRVEEAIESYRSQPSPKELFPLTKLATLDLLCRTNSGRHTPVAAADLYMDLQEPQPTWRMTDEIKSLFEELKGEFPQAHISLIAGMCEHHNNKQAKLFYDEAVQTNILLPIEIHNLMLACMTEFHADATTTWTEIGKTLAYLEEHAIRPDVATFNAVLLSLSKLPQFTSRVDNAFQIMAEMKKCRVEPTLTTYHHLITLVYDVVNFSRHRPGLIRAILDDVEHKQFRETGSFDSKFFSLTMRNCKRLSQVDLGQRLFKMAYSGWNKQLLFSNINASVQFNNDYLFLVALHCDNVEELKKAYHSLIPRVILPMRSVWSKLVVAADTFGDYELLFSFIKQIADRKPYKVHESLSEMIDCLPTGESSEYNCRVLEVADELFKIYLTQISNMKMKNIDTVKLTPSNYGKFIQLSLIEGRTVAALQWLERFEKKTQTDEKNCFFESEVRNDRPPKKGGQEDRPVRREESDRKMRHPISMVKESLIDAKSVTDLANQLLVENNEKGFRTAMEVLAKYHEPNLLRGYLAQQKDVITKQLGESAMHEAESLLQPRRQDKKAKRGKAGAGKNNL